MIFAAALGALMPVTRRAATYADLDAILSLISQSFAPHHDIIGDWPGPRPDALLAATGRGEVILVEADRNLIGLLWTFPDADALIVNLVAVAPAWQRQGIGARLMAIAEALAREKGQGILRLNTAAGLAGNLDFYVHLGFIETDRRVERGFERAFLEKHLT
jgi:GNAT superfamily N-acetyltransferase